MNNLARFPISVSAVRHPRAGFESIPRDISKAELLRYFTYSENDLQEINFCRGVGNRIVSVGFGINSADHVELPSLPHFSKNCEDVQLGMIADGGDGYGRLCLPCSTPSSFLPFCTRRPALRLLT
jgi:hypothetical protein